MTTNLNSFTKNDYKIIKREVPYQGMFRMAIYTLRFKLFNGEWSNEIVREMMERQSAVAILPYDPILDKVILIEQFRLGAINSNANLWLLEIVAGIIEKDDKPESVAIREAKEEANCEVLDIHPICEYFVSPGGCNEYIWVFCGCVDAANAGGIYGLQAEDENINTLVLDADDAFKLLNEGKISTSPAIISLQWLQMNRTWLREKWQKK